MIFAAYQPLFERLLDFATQPAFDAQVQEARADYFCRAGEVFETDRAYDGRMQAFLDWYTFDRPLRGVGEPPVRAFAARAELSREEALRFRILGRTVHGVFVVEQVSRAGVEVVNLLTHSRYTVADGRWVGLERGSLFEARLVPFDGAYHFSPAFVFHPPDLRERIENEALRRVPGVGVQDFIWILSRMAARAEHYRNVTVDKVYDFEHPPPLVVASRMRFDRESIDQRLGRVPPSR